MTHKVLIQLESDIEAQAQKNLAEAKAKDKHLLDASAVMAWNLCLDKIFSQGPELTPEQMLEIENARTSNMKKD